MNRVIDIFSNVENAGDRVCLDYDERSRRRAVMLSEEGTAFVLDQERPRQLRGGEIFVLDNGSLIEIVAKPEALIAIQCPNMSTLVRIAWHLGNRHLPTQIVVTNHESSLRIRDDHVIQEMVAGLGGICNKVMEPFDPEGGAYAKNVAPHAH